MKRHIKLRIAISLLWGVPLIFFSLFVLISRVSIGLHGEIQEATKRCRYENPSSCSYTYKIKDSNGKIVFYTANPSDQDLMQGLVKGDKIDKNSWEIDYKVNGNIIKDFDTNFYLALLLVGFLSFIQGIYLVPFKKVKYQ